MAFSGPGEDEGRSGGAGKMKSEESEQNDSSRDLELDRLMAQAMRLEVPEELIHRAMQRLPAGATQIGRAHV